MTPEEHAERIRSMFVIRSYSNGSGKTVERVDIEVHRIADEIWAAVDEETKDIEARVHRKKLLIDELVEHILTVRAKAYEDALQWVAAEARDCGCSERIEKHIRAAMREATKESER